MRQERKEEYRNRVNYKHANFVLRFISENSEYRKMVDGCGVPRAPKRRRRAIGRIRYRRLVKQPVPSLFSEF